MSCPWSWHNLPCALERGHPSPHQIVGEQPQFAQAERAVIDEFVEQANWQHEYVAGTRQWSSQGCIMEMWCDMPAKHPIHREIGRG